MLEIQVGRTSREDVEERRWDNDYGGGRPPSLRAPRRYQTMATAMRTAGIMPRTSVAATNP